MSKVTQAGNNLPGLKCFGGKGCWRAAISSHLQDLPSEGTLGKNSPFSAPLDSLEILSLQSLFLGRKNRSALFPGQWKIHIVWLFCFRGRILECARLRCMTTAVWLRGSAKTLRSAQLDSSLGSAAHQLCDLEQVT